MMEETHISLEADTFKSKLSLDIDLKRNTYSFCSPNQEMVKITGSINDLRELQSLIQRLTDSYIYLSKLNPKPF